MKTFPQIFICDTKIKNFESNSIMLDCRMFSSYEFEIIVENHQV